MKTTGYNSLRSWGIVLVCSAIYAVCLLPFKAAPIYYVAFLDRYATNRESASFVVIIPNILRCFAGPVTGFFCEILGIRALTVLGCFLSALGLAICFFAEDITLVTVFMGLIYGIGMTLGTPLLPQAIKQHFLTNITNANGVFRAVSCLLTFAVIPLLSFLLETYGCSGMLLLTGGIMFQTVPMAMLLGDPKYSQTKNSLRTNLNLEYRNQNSNADATTGKKLLNNDHIEDRSKDVHVDTRNKEEQQSNNETDIGNKNLNTAATNGEKLLPNCRIGQNNEMGEYVGLDITKEDRNQLKCVEKGTISCNDPSNKGKSQLMTPNAMHPLLNANNEQNQIYQKDSSRSEAEVKKSKFRRACLTLTVFKDPAFVVIMLTQSGIAYVSLFVMPILNDYSRDKDIRKDTEKYLIMGYIVFQMVGYTCLGWLVDKGFVKISNYVATNSLCMGLACCAMRFSSSFATLFLATAAFSTFLAALSSSLPTLVYEFIGKSLQSMAISSALVLLAPLSFSIAPLIGYFRGNLGSYDGGMYLMTAICVGCATLIFMLPQIQKCGKKKNDIPSTAAC